MKNGNKKKILRYKNKCISVTENLTVKRMKILQKCNDNFQGQLFFSREKTNSCLFAIGYHGENSSKAVQVLIIEAKVENENVLLINLYYATTESEQLSTLLDLSSAFLIKAWYCEVILTCFLKLN